MGRDGESAESREVKEDVRRRRSEVSKDGRRLSGPDPWSS
jgi:hypothetical protein